MKKELSYDLEWKRGQCRSEIRCSVQSDLDLHRPRKFVMSSTVGKELTLSQTINFRLYQIERVCRRQFQI